MFFLKLSFFIAFVFIVVSILQEYVLKRVILGRSAGHFLNKFSDLKVVRALAPKVDTPEYDKLYTSLRDAGLKITVNNYIFLWIFSMLFFSAFSICSTFLS